MSNRIEEPEQECEFKLVARLRQGDDRAMVELVQQFGPALHRLIGRLTGWSADVEDILQDVFLVAWRRIDTFRGSGPLYHWLRKLAVNRCHSHHRARLAFQRLLARVSPFQPTNVDPPRENPAQHRVQQALRRLRHADRTILVLFYLEELSGDELASTLGIRLESVHMRLHRARGRLRAILEKEELNDGSG